MNNKLTVNAFLFDDFTSLDLFAPIELLSRLDNVKFVYLSLGGKEIKSAQGCVIKTNDFSAFVKDSILLIPGGLGTRALVDDEVIINSLQNLAQKSSFVLCVCTGSALLAKTSHLNGKKATSNQKAFEWVKSQNSSVLWQENVRFVKDGNIYTSAGVSAGLDMTLEFIKDNYNLNKAKEIAQIIEYDFKG